MNDEDISNSSKTLRESIIEYVKKYPDCDKQKVVEYCNKEHIGSRMTVMRLIKELGKEEILKIERERKNSKGYKLTVISENLLLNFTENLKEIFTNFKIFVNNIDEIYKKVDEYKKESNERYRILVPLMFSKETYDEALGKIPSLPYDLIEIINDVFIFTFIFILPKRLDNKDYISKLYSIYFDNLLKMYSYASEKLQDVISSLDRTSLTKSIIYRNYIDSQNKKNFEKVCDTYCVCYILDITDSLNRVLKSLWIKNIDSAFLSYDLIHNINLNEYYQENFNKQHDAIGSDKYKLNMIYFGIRTFMNVAGFGHT